MTLCAAPLPAQQRYVWKEESFLPDLRLPTIDGSETISLSDFRGTKLLLIEFASW